MNGAAIRRVARWGAALFGIASGSVLAQGVETDAVLSKFMRGPIQASANGWTIGANFGAPVARNWAIEGTGAGLKVAASEAISIAAKGGPLAVTATQRVGLGAAAGAVARVMSAGHPVMAVGSAGYLLYEMYRVHEASQYPGTQCGDQAGLLCYDPGTEKVTDKFACYKAPGGPYDNVCESTAYAAGQRWVSLANSTGYSDFPGGCSPNLAVFRFVGATEGLLTYERMTITGGVCGVPTSATPWVAQTWSITKAEETQTKCPASIDAVNPAYSVPAGEAPGPDGKCRTARYNHQPMSKENAAAKVVAFPPGLGADVLVRDALKAAVEQGDETVPAAIATEGPATQQGEATNVRTQTPTGTTTTTTRPVYSYNYAGDQVTYSTTTVTQSCVGENACSTETAETTVTQPQVKPDPIEVITCGLPGKPACKMDESGTPKAAADDSAQRSEGYIAGIKTCVLTPSACLPALPSLNWSFSLPSSCSPIPLAGFGQVLTQIDMCTYQPMIHDLVSMLWAGGGLFGAIRLMFRGS